MFRQLSTLRVSCKQIFFHPAIKSSNAFRTMSDETLQGSGAPLTDVVGVLERFASPSLAASWDNVGLLIEPTDPKHVWHVLLTNDLTESVMQEALTLETDLIITYHPLIFAPMKSVTTKTWKERIVAKCLENKIAVYSPHTAFDSVVGGVNDWLASAFQEVILERKPIEQDAQEPANGMGRFCTLRRSISIGEAVESVKQLTGLKHVRLARARGTNDRIASIALCAGSGATVLKGVKADLYVTGEMLHHDILDAVHRGSNVILTNHSDSERGFLKTFASRLHDMLNKSVRVSVSECDADPLVTV